MFEILILASLLGVLKIIYQIRAENKERKRVKDQWERFNGSRKDLSDDILDD